MKQSRKISTKKSNFWNQEIKLNTFLKLLGGITLLLLFVGLPIWYVYSAVTFKYQGTLRTPSPYILLSSTPTPTQIPVIYYPDNFGWKTYTNDKYRFAFQYPAVGVVMDRPCFSNKNGYCSFHIGECGMIIRKNEHTYGDSVDTNYIDSFFSVNIWQQTGSIRDYLLSSDFDQKDAIFLSASRFNADEVVQLTNNDWDMVPLSHVRYIFRKGIMYVSINSLQNDGNGCEDKSFYNTEGQSQVIKNVPEWNVLDSFKFF